MKRTFEEIENSNGSYKDDFNLENGYYLNTCKCCLDEFFGHKRRTVCKECDKEILSAWFGNEDEY